jgi:hypothetical protein
MDFLRPPPASQPVHIIFDPSVCDAVGGGNLAPSLSRLRWGLRFAASGVVLASVACSDFVIERI